LAGRFSQNSEINYQSAPRKIPEEQRSHLDRGRSLKSRICVDIALILNKTHEFMLSVTVDSIA